MKRLLLRLYPRSWRDRYGDELLVMLDDRSTRPSDLFDVVFCALGERLIATRGAGPVTVTSGGTGMYSVDMRAFNRRQDLAVAALLALPLFFLVVVTLKYGFGVDGPFDALEGFFVAPAVQVLTVAAPFVALALSGLAGTGVSLSRDGSALRADVRLRMTSVQLATIVASALVAATFVVYYLIENY